MSRQTAHFETDSRRIGSSYVASFGAFFRPCSSRSEYCDGCRLGLTGSIWRSTFDYSRIVFARHPSRDSFASGSTAGLRSSIGTCSAKPRPLLLAARPWRKARRTRFPPYLFRTTLRGLACSFCEGLISELLSAGVTPPVWEPLLFEFGFYDNVALGHPRSKCSETVDSCWYYRCRICSSIQGFTQLRGLRFYQRPCLTLFSYFSKFDSRF